MKDEILANIKIIDILEKYNIPYRNKKLHCPFHGEDKHASATAYDTHFHCFACQRHLDVIGFVEEYFNLSFKEAMQKINIDFDLGLNPDTPVDYYKLNEIKQAQFEKKKIKEKQIKKYCQLCDLKYYYNAVIKHCTKRVNIKNWEKLTHAISYFEEKLFQIDNELEILDNKLSTRI